MGVFAVVISVFALVYSRRATISSERSTAVSERQEQRQLDEAAERAVRWRFLPQPVVVFAGEPKRDTSHDVISMANEGEGAAYDVRVDLYEGDTLVGGPLVNGATIH